MKYQLKQLRGTTFAAVITVLFTLLCSTNAWLAIPATIFGLATLGSFRAEVATRLRLAKELTIIAQESDKSVPDTEQMRLAIVRLSKQLQL